MRVNLRRSVRGWICWTIVAGSIMILEMKTAVVIAGAGLAGQWHAHSAVKAGGVIAGIADPDLKKAAALAKTYNAEVFENLQEAIRQIHPEVVHICAPSPTHANLALAALQSGVSVLIEKPFASDLRQTELILNAAKEAKRKVCVVHQFLFQPGMLQIRKRLSRIGKPVILEAVIHSAGGVGREQELDAIVSEILPHPLSLMQELVPSGVPADGWLIQRAGSGELSCLNAAAAATLTIRISMNARPTANYITLGGTLGTYHADLFHGYSFFQTGAVSRTRKIAQPLDTATRTLGSAAANLLSRTLQREPAYPGLTRLIRDFYRCVQGQGEPPLSMQHILAVARAREGITAEAQRRGET